MKIAINGPMCSGKSTIANIIKEHNDRYSIYSFGGRVKELAFELFGMRNKDRSLLINIAPKSAYNFKQNIGMKQNINYSIIHFKGRINHWQNTKYLDTFKKLTNTQ